MIFNVICKNNLNLGEIDEKQRKLTQKIALVSKKNAVNEYSKTKRKYNERKSPPYPANKNCGKKMAGNDGEMYESKPNKNNVCSWKKI